MSNTLKKRKGYCGDPKFYICMVLEVRETSISCYSMKDNLPGTGNKRTVVLDNVQRLDNEGKTEQWHVGVLDANGDYVGGTSVLVTFWVQKNGVQRIEWERLPKTPDEGDNVERKNTRHWVKGRTVKDSLKDGQFKIRLDPPLEGTSIMAKGVAAENWIAYAADDFNKNNNVKVTFVTHIPKSDEIEKIELDDWAEIGPVRAFGWSSNRDWKKPVDEL